MSTSDGLPWRTEEERADIQANLQKAEELRGWIRNAASAIHLAVWLDLGEEVVERHVDHLWNGLRAVALNPKTVDQVLEIALQSLADDAWESAQRTLHEFDDLPVTKRNLRRKR